MSGHSEKKAKKKAGSASQIHLLLIFISTGIYLLIHLFKYFVKGNKDVFSKKEIFGFSFLSLINYILYKALNMFHGSYLYSYLLDFLGLNCLIEILINFSKKFWYLYFIYPGYFLIKGGKSLFGYVSNIGKQDDTMEEEESNVGFRDQGHKAKQIKDKNAKDKNKQKVKYVKH